MREMIETFAPTGRQRSTATAARSARQIVEWTVRAIERRRQRGQLAELDDRLLKDIGVSRYDVRREVAKPFWR